MKKTKNAMFEGEVSAAVTAEVRPEASAKDGAHVRSAGVTTASAAPGRVEGCGSRARTAKGKKADAEVLIPFKDVTVSKWNENSGTVLNAARVKDLANGIRRHGLFHPVMLIRNTAPSGPMYTVIAGAHRIEALKQLRGEDSGLQFGEFIINGKLIECNPKCLDYSLSENNRRYGVSVIDRANLIKRMCSEQHICPKILARRLGLNRETMSRLVKLADRFDSLPECWRNDLAIMPVLCGKLPKKAELPRITLSHWIVVTQHLVGNESGISDEIKTVMEKTHTKKWSIRVLRRELEKVHPITNKEQRKASAKGEKPAALELGRKKKSLRDSYEAMKLVNPALAEQIRLQLESMEKEGASAAPESEPGAEPPATVETTEAKPTA